jgi:hypothetical protein
MDAWGPSIETIFKEISVQGFDLLVHGRDLRSGKVITENHYVARFKKTGEGESEVHFERPPGSGLFYTADGQLDKKKSSKGLDEQKRKEVAEAERLRILSMSPEEKEAYELDKARALLARHDEKQRIKKAEEEAAKKAAKKAEEDAAKKAEADRIAAEKLAPAGGASQNGGK